MTQKKKKKYWLEQWFLKTIVQMTLSNREFKKKIKNKKTFFNKKKVKK